MQKIRRSVKEITFIKACLFGVGLAILTAVLVAMLIAAIISGEYIELNFIQYITPLGMLLAVVLGSLTAGKLVTQKRAQLCAVVSGVFVILQCCTALLFFDGISTSFFIGFVACLLGCIIAIFLSGAGKNSVKRTRKRRHHR